MTASVRLQVARRFGQRTWRSSYQAPAKYAPIAANGFLRLALPSPFEDGLASITFFFGVFASAALMRVTLLVLSVFLVGDDLSFVAKVLLSQIK